MNIFRFLDSAAARHPDDPALFENEKLVATFSELRSRCLRDAALFSERCALAPRDRVALFASNSASYIQRMWAAWASGLCVVPINAKLHVKEAAYILANSGSRICFADRDNLPGLQEAIAQLDLSVVIIDICADSASWTECPASSEPSSGPRDLAWLFYTSGTTGRPKGVMLTHENLRQMVLNFRADVDTISRGDCQIHFAPLSHGSGMYMIAHVQAGAANVVPVDRPLSSEHLESLLAIHRGALMFCAPTMIHRLMDQPDLSPAAKAALKTIVYGGGPMFVTDIQRAYHRYGDKFVQIYGQGETPMTITTLPRLDIRAAAERNDAAVLGSVGYGFPGIELRIIDADGHDVGPDVPGQILVRGPTVMRGYWNDQKSTAYTLVAGWLHTGDIGTLDSRGLLTLKDRAKDVIISGGVNIYPREVEEALLQHPRVKEAAVLGEHDPDWGEHIVACLVLADDSPLAETELDAVCLSQIARFKRPKRYVFLPELPKNSYGKVLKRELRAQLTQVGCTA